MNDVVVNNRRKETMWRGRKDNKILPPAFILQGGSLTADARHSTAQAGSPLTASLLIAAAAAVDPKIAHR